ncbi:hypothetical protein BH11BAC7_BH11BAC7_09420 [soil metagenome]
MLRSLWIWSWLAGQLYVLIGYKGEFPYFREAVVTIIALLIYRVVSRNIYDLYVDGDEVVLAKGNFEISVAFTEIKNITLMPMPLIRSMPLYHEVELFKPVDGRTDYLFHSASDESTEDFLIKRWKIARALQAQESIKRRGGRR